MADRNDYGTTVIHGKSVPSKRIVSNPDAHLKDTNITNKVNSAVLERKIDSGEMALHPFIDKDTSHAIQTKRIATKNGDKTMTQKDLATRANQFGGKCIVAKDISDIESGIFRMTTENKLKVQAVKKALSI